MIPLNLHKGTQTVDSSTGLLIRIDHEFDCETFIRPHMIQACFTKGIKQLPVAYYDKSGNKISLKARPLKPHMWIITAKELIKIDESFPKFQIVFCVHANAPKSLKHLNKLFTEMSITTICMSAMGYFQQTWFDGWLGIWSHHAICGLLPPGSSGVFNTQIPIESVLDADHLTKDFFDKNWQLQASLVARLRKKKPLSTSFYLESSKDSDFDEFAIILLRLAFPSRVFYFPGTLFSGKKLVRIKKYCQPIIFIKSSLELAHNTTHIRLNEEEIVGKISTKKKDDLYQYFLDKLGFRRD